MRVFKNRYQEEQHITNTCDVFKLIIFNFYPWLIRVCSNFLPLISSSVINTWLIICLMPQLNPSFYLFSLSRGSLVRQRYPKGLRHLYTGNIGLDRWDIECQLVSLPALSTSTWTISLINTNNHHHHNVSVQELHHAEQTKHAIKFLGTAFKWGKTGWDIWKTECQKDPSSQA